MTAADAQAPLAAITEELPKPSQLKGFRDQYKNKSQQERDKAEKQEYYRTGLQLNLEASSDDSDSNQPDWLFATFSIVLPVPNDSVLLDSDTEFLELEGWERGRFQGIHGIKPQGKSDFVNAHFQSAKARFSTQFGEAVGREESDLDNGNGGNNFRFYSCELKEVNGQTVFDLTHQWKNNFYEIFKDLPDRALTGRVRLAAVEYLQFIDENQEIKDDRESDRKSRRTQYLVLHVVATDCENHTLTQISEALSKPRNYVRLRNKDDVDPRIDRAEYFKKNSRNERDINISEHLIILKYFTDLGIQLVNDGLQKSHHSLKATLTNGGFLGTDGTKNNARHPVPQRVVCAVPSSSIEQFPRLFQNGKEGEIFDPKIRDEDHQWAITAGWGWQLATGADTFMEGIPAVQRDCFDDHVIDDFHLWTIVADSKGLAFVKKPNFPLNRDNKFWMLACTRYVDLLLINMRSEYGLYDLQNELRKRAEDTGGSEIETLENNLEQLENVQRKALSFRRHLWFESTGNHAVDNTTLSRIQMSSGNRQLYDDFLGELNLRRDIYETLYRRASSEAQSAHAEQVRKDQKQREDEKEAKQSAEQRKERRFNTLLAILGIAFATPAWAEAFGFPFGLPTGFGSLAVALFLIGLVLIWFRFRKSKSD